MIPVNIGERLKAERERRGLSMGELARRAGINPGTTSRAEAGQREKLSKRTATKLETALELPVGTLGGIEPEKLIPKPSDLTERDPVSVFLTVTKLLYYWNDFYMARTPGGRVTVPVREYHSTALLKASPQALFGYTEREWAALPSYQRDLLVDDYKAIERSYKFLGRYVRNVAPDHVRGGLMWPTDSEEFETAVWQVVDYVIAKGLELHAPFHDTPPDREKRTRTQRAYNLYMGKGVGHGMAVALIRKHCGYTIASIEKWVAGPHETAPRKMAPRKMAPREKVPREAPTARERKKLAAKSLAKRCAPDGRELFRDPVRVAMLAFEAAGLPGDHEKLAAYAKRLAKDHAPGGRELFEDLMQMAIIAAFSAAETWHPSGGASFETYAYRRMEWRIQDYLKAERRATAYLLDEDKLVADGGDGPPHVAMDPDSEAYKEGHI